MKNDYIGVDKAYVKIYAEWLITISILMAIKDSLDMKSVFNNMKDDEIKQYIGKFGKLPLN